MTKEELLSIKENSGLSVREFCRQINLSFGDFYRIIQDRKRLNERIEKNVLLFVEKNAKQKRKTSDAKVSKPTFLTKVASFFKK